MATNVIRCPLCGYQVLKLLQLVSHLRLVHSGDPNFELLCGIGGCQQEFRAFSAFSSHVYRSHRAALGLLAEDPSDKESPPSSSQQQVTVADNEMDCGILELQPSNWEETCNPVLLHSEPEQQVAAAKFLLGLKENKHISQTAIDDVVSGCGILISGMVNSLKVIVQRKLLEAGVAYAVIEDINDAISELPDPFSGLQTAYLQNKFYKDHFHYVEPQEVVFGQPYYSWRFSGSKREAVLKADKFYHIPLLQTLEQVVTHSDVWYELNTSRERSAYLQDFCDGSLFKSHPLFSLDVNGLQIIGYYDELEICNPLGSYVQTHKLGCLFFSLGNVRPQFRSSLKAIYLVTLARSEDIDKYGLDKFLTPFVEDLKVLYCDGITICTNEKQHTLYGGLLAFLADNLAAHALGGFKESMSFALRICRSCMVTTEQAQNFTKEAECYLRTPRLHAEQCDRLQGPLGAHHSTNSGINRRSILEDIPGFSVVSGLPHDIMHDLFEGVAGIELKLLLQHCVKKHYFSINFLNDRMRRFDFVVDKPALIDLKSSDAKIRQSASQMIALITELPLLIGDRIPEDDENWNSFLILLKICKIALSPRCTPDTIAYLRVLIEEKLFVFKKLYPDRRITPKMHYMLHYPAQIEKYGPLIHTWTMRNEAKLSFIKQASRSGNFKNVAKTIANHHQLWLCYQLQCQDHLLHQPPLFSPKSVSVQLDMEPVHLQRELLQLFPSTLPESLICHPQWARIQSTTYKPGVFVLLCFKDLYPKFGKVVDICVIDTKIALYLQTYESTYNGHYDAYVLKSSWNFVVVPLNALVHHHALQPQQSFDDTDRCLYISLRFMY